MTNSTKEEINIGFKQTIPITQSVVRGTITFYPYQYSDSRNQKKLRLFLMYLLTRGFLDKHGEKSVRAFLKNDSPYKYFQPFSHGIYIECRKIMTSISYAKLKSLSKLLWACQCISFEKIPDVHFKNVLRSFVANMGGFDSPWHRVNSLLSISSRIHTPTDISEITGVPKADVLSLLTKKPDRFRHSDFKNNSGEYYYTIFDRPKGWRERLAQIKDIFGRL